MKRIAVQGLCLMVLVLVALPGQAREDTLENVHVVERAGDMLQVGVPLVAFGLTFFLGEEPDPDADSAGFSTPGLRLDRDWLSMGGSPRHDLGLAIARTEIATYTLKYSVNADRPNGGGQSFPSGHTSVAFAGAEFIRKEYGGWWGVPAYLTAGYVGWSRVVTRNHYARDVYAGAAIGILSNYDVLNFTIPFGQLTVVPSLIYFGDSGSDPGLSMIRDPQDMLPTTMVPGLQFQLQF